MLLPTSRRLGKHVRGGKGLITPFETSPQEKVGCPLGTPFPSTSGRSGKRDADPHTLWLKGDFWRKRGRPAPLTGSCELLVALAPLERKTDFLFKFLPHLLLGCSIIHMKTGHPRENGGAGRDEPSPEESAELPPGPGGWGAACPQSCRLRRRGTRSFVEITCKNCPELGATRIGFPPPPLLPMVTFV